MIQVLHEVKDFNKFESIKNNMINNGWQGRSILVADMGDYLQALTGSHRIAAAKELDIEIPMEIIEYDLFNRICEECNWDLDMITRDLDGFCKCLKDYNESLANLLSEDL